MHWKRKMLSFGIGDGGTPRKAQKVGSFVSNVKVAFRILHDEQVIPPGYQYMDCHLVFDVKFDGFKFKARMVAGGHMVEPPPIPDVRLSRFKRNCSDRTHKLLLCTIWMSRLLEEKNSSGEAQLTKSRQKYSHTDDNNDDDETTSSVFLVN
jgi:hypothetical protein